MKTTKGGKVMNPTDAYRKELRKKELKRVREVGILKKDPETLKEQIDKLEMMKANGALDKARKHKKRQLEDTLNLVIKKQKRDWDTKIVEDGYLDEAKRHGEKPYQGDDIEDLIKLIRNVYVHHAQDGNFTGINKEIKRVFYRLLSHLHAILRMKEGMCRGRGFQPLWITTLEIVNDGSGERCIKTLYIDIQISDGFELGYCFTPQYKDLEPEEDNKCQAAMVQFYDNDIGFDGGQPDGESKRRKIISSSGQTLSLRFCLTRMCIAILSIVLAAYWRKESAAKAGTAGEMRASVWNLFV
ncbi:hypothetical protein C1H46_038086 [Malus baccata]|uniref:Wbp11/ELF5/Saf1 N-terminal domain-containing protein n=1 Tax=Malus baccata TaxID=106549 RepID=A0A540KQ86_MALBA|nr:hypothetical protein C1H46_038086 [Malus baccata]